MEFVNDILHHIFIVVCESSQFSCHNKVHCVSKNKICDLRKDCGDGSDELTCGKFYCLYINESKNYIILYM